MNHDSGTDDMGSSDRAERMARLTVIAIVVTLVVVSIAYRALVVNHLEHTSLVFIGLPALAAITLLHTRPRTAIGTVNKVIAILLCLSGILFGEGLICILMAAPIFFLVGTVIGFVINKLSDRRPPDDPRSGNWRGVVTLVVVPLSLEGVVPSLVFEREQEVTVSRTVEATPDDVRLALASTPRFDRELPRFFRLGFPTPMHTAGGGLRVGDERRVMFAHGQHHSGALVMRVASADSASAVFTMASDSSYITHWLSWEEASVRWAPAGAGHTRVTWTLRYRRRLDPAWYFAPLERYGVGLAAGYLIETLATPQVATGR
jgi:hypothetical protein